MDRSEIHRTQPLYITEIRTAIVNLEPAMPSFGVKLLKAGVGKLDEFLVVNIAEVPLGSV